MRRALAALALAGTALAVAVAPSTAQDGGDGLPAFPGAQGFGAGATGGRGGDVVIVDTLEPFGPGSLGDALAPEDCRPRIVVFRVSGVIEVPGRHDLELTCGDLTVAGQTAPGAGITVAGRIDAYAADPAGNIILRHLRFRPPPITDEEGADDNLGLVYDALQMSNNPNMVLDHLSLAWGSDETLDLYEFASDVTLQWSTIEVSNTEGQGEPHNTGMMVGPDSPRVTIHHSVFAHHRNRCPAMGSGPAQLLNTVVYDCQDGFVHHNPAEGEFQIAGNSFIHGPSHEEFTPLYFDDQEPGGSTYWLSQNEIVAPGQFEGVVDDIADTPLAEAAFSTGTDPGQVIAEPSDFTAESDTYVPVDIQDPGDAFDAVLAGAGAFPHDAVTRRTMEEVREGTGSWDPLPPDNLLEGLTPGEAPADDDADGMADEWELDNGLDPADGDDHATVLASGYTAIEEHVNELADQLTGASPDEPTDEPAPTSAPVEPVDDAEPAPVAAEVAGGGGDDVGGGWSGAEVVAVGVAAALLGGAAGGAVVRRRHRPASSG